MHEQEHEHEHERKQTRLKKLGAALIAIFGAIALWLYVVTVVSPNSSRIIRDIPISFEGAILLEEQDLIMTSEGGTVSIKVTGDRVNLGKLNNQNIRVIADLSRASITKPGDYTVSLSVSLPDGVGKTSFDFLDKSKSQIDIAVAQLVTKTIPVALDTGEEKAKEGFFFDSGNATADPAEITVSGPDYEVSEITRAVIDCKNISQLEETVVEKRPIVLQKTDGAAVQLELSKVSQTEATVSLPIQKYKELKLAVDVKDGGGATSENVESLHLSAESVLVRGSSSQIDNLDDVLVVGTFDLSRVALLSQTKAFHVSLPSGIKNVDGLDHIEATIRLKGLRTQTYMIFASEVEMLNTPPNATATVNAEKVAVKLRGPEEDIAALDVSNIHIHLDLSNVSQSGEVLATVSVSDYPKVAVIDDVYVDITLK